MNRDEKLKQLRSIFKDIGLFGILEDGSIETSRYKEDWGNIRLACTRMGIFNGDANTLKKYLKCMELFGANNYSLYTGGDNYWIDFNYRMTDDEIKEVKRIDLIKQLDDLQQ